MRKSQKKQAEDFLKLLGQAHDEIKRWIENGNILGAMDMLGQCQEGAVGLGNLIEKTEGEGTHTVSLLEEYCELTYEIYQQLAEGQELNGNGTCKRLRKSLIQIENSVRNEIPLRFEIVFLPYKASMWDSMESVWQAADADPDCDAYVVPIPYYDRNPDGSLGTFHYEGKEFPSEVPVTSYGAYSLKGRQPDVIYIHNPYDYANYVTSVSPEYYSSELKKYTDCLVYIPYYSTSGGMSEGQAACPAYYYADYIMIQAEKYKKFFDPSVPREKLIPMGSPKFDRTLRMCENPPDPPEAWKEKLEGHTVYFYNTSLNGMLGNTEQFLRKMRYVFSCFEGRADACLLWRPHPLMESTFASMRGDYKPQYDALREEFIRKGLGIYDDTPDISSTIALCDAYIGDAGTSVTSLFGMAGKPQFILDHNICTTPEDGDWRGAVVRSFPVISGVRDGIPCMEEDSWIMTQGNKLYRARKGEDSFRYFCDLSSYASGGYYGGPLLINGKTYMFPVNAQDILVIGEKGIEKRIQLDYLVERAGAFYTAAVVGNYLFLTPNQYPAIVRYDTRKDEVRYFDIDKSPFVGMVNGERRCGGVGVKGMDLYLASPTDGHVLEINGETGEWKQRTIATESPGGCMAMILSPIDGDFWLLPFEGSVVTRWNPETGETRDYQAFPEGFVCRHITYGYECVKQPFSGAVFYKNQVYLSPCWGNQYVCLNQDTGEVREWTASIEQPEQPINGYFASWARGYLAYFLEGDKVQEYRLLSLYDGRIYRVDFEKEMCEEIPLIFDKAELKEHEPGFREQSQWLQYACSESCFNTLTDFLDGTLCGNSFDREQQLLAYGQLSANSDGTSGEKIHAFVRSKI
ncbi:MAG: hypothetical protein HFI30_01095 [Lachnospiraceae bacterium]|jgi:hypothetical protein|nr:hypothetical protein [Lachnospiraceae bacterium]